VVELKPLVGGGTAGGVREDVPERARVPRQEARALVAQLHDGARGGTAEPGNARHVIGCRVMLATSYGAI